MAHGKNRADWAHTSHLIALLININRQKGKRVVQPREFNPYAQKRSASSKPDFYITPMQLGKVLAEQ